MTLIVEDGTGRSDAEAYASVAAFKTSCDNLGRSYVGITDAVIEQKLRIGALFIDTSARYKGARLVSTQAREFPRSGLYDWSGIEVTGLPARVALANIELAFKALTDDLMPDLDRGGKIQSESVGPISVTYAADAPAGRAYTMAQNLLGQYVRTDGDMMTAPSLATTDDASFSMAMHDTTDPLTST